MSNHVLVLPTEFSELLQTLVSPNLAASCAAVGGNTSVYQTTTMTLRDSNQFDIEFQALRRLAKDAEQGNALSRLNFSEPALQAALSSGQLVMSVMKRNKVFVAGMGHILDRLDGTLLQKFAVIDTRSAPENARSLLTLDAMRAAVQTGYIFYDFGQIRRKDCADFETTNERSNILFVERDPAADLILDPICVGPALKRVSDFVSTGKKMTLLPHANR